jgi:hypothetical protein
VPQCAACNIALFCSAECRRKAEGAHACFPAVSAMAKAMPIVTMYNTAQAAEFEELFGFIPPEIAPPREPEPEPKPEPPSHSDAKTRPLPRPASVRGPPQRSADGSAHSTAVPAESRTR